MFDTLHTLIAPGNRARLSPYVEAAQFKVLFDERPDPLRRQEDARRILDARASLIRDWAGVWVDFSQRGKHFRPDEYSTQFLAGYLAYYFTVNVCKVQLLLLDLARQGWLSDELAVVDVGVGTATTAVATIDFLLAWSSVCDLYEQPFPVRSLRLTGFDASPCALGYAQRVLEAYLDALAESDAAPVGQTSFVGILDGARAARWLSCDLNTAVPDVGGKPVVLVASNLFNELEAPGRVHLGRLVATLPDHSLAVVIEPGARKSTNTLNAWRSELTSGREDLQVLLPCASEFGTSPPAACRSCWNARREHLHTTLLYEAFRRQASTAGPNPDRRSWDAFENYLLSWSYTVLRKAPSRTESPPVRVTASQGVLSGVLRFVGGFERAERAFVSEDQGWLPAAEEPETAARAARETLKFCPAALDGTGVSVLSLCRPAGFAVPKMAHGELVQINGLTVRVEEGRGRLLAPTGASLKALESPSRAASVFLAAYGPRTRAAVDAIAFRLFGFPSLRPFQHAILDRVLTGHSVLGIAATGGGKSECYILPAMLLAGITVVVSPLKSLMQDQYEQRIKDRYGLHHLTTFINGDVPFGERDARLKRMELGYYKLVYFTPEQLERGYVLDSLARAHAAVGVRYLALDEAHCISQWGHDFRASYLNIHARLRQRGIECVRIALTATASPPVRVDLCRELGLRNALLAEGGDVFIDSSNRPELNLIVRVVRTSRDRTQMILEALRGLQEKHRQGGFPGAAIVFMPWTGGDPVRTADTVDRPRAGHLSAGASRFAQFLEKSLGSRVALYHGKMEDELEDEGDSGGDGAETTAPEDYEEQVRTRRLGDLSGRSRRHEQFAFITDLRDVMVATKGFGMGIDKPNIRLIIHRTPPGNLEAYAQEAGRAGRDGGLASTILFYAPDAPEDEGLYGSEAVPSDFEIQRRFLENKYVRRLDVLLMRAFLLDPARTKVGGSIFFTSDEAVSFFDHCQQVPVVGVTERFSWPRFQDRVRRGRESAEHEALLDRGHQYQEKSRYVGRILAVMHRIRPSLAGRGRLAFLEAVHDVRPVLRQPEVLSAAGIVNATYYFGPVLREKCVTAAELRELLLAAAGPDSLIPLAQRLGITLAEAVRLVSDIREAEGTWVTRRNGDDERREWQGNLLRLRSMVAPKVGPAAGKNGVAAWREYAGAVRRASKTAAWKSAKDARRSAPTLDDWFGWRQLPQPRAWEVTLGPAFLLAKEFDAYVEQFLKEHDDREQNDWASFRRLLTDYVGVSEQGELLTRQARSCLRAVMLGYLETFEVVEGDDCGGCSRCRERLDFEQDLQWRRKVIVRMGPRLIARLRDLKPMEDRLPNTADTEGFWADVAEEERAGRAVQASLLGWTGKLIKDVPSHQAARWLRLSGMGTGRLPLQMDDLVENAERLAEACGIGEAARLLALLNQLGLETAHEIRLVPARATLHRRLGDCSGEATCWHSVFGNAPADDRGDAPLAYAAHDALARLTAAGTPLADEAAHEAHALNAARLALEITAAAKHYAVAVRRWTAVQIVQELSDWVAGAVSLPAEEMAPRLLRVWLEPDREGRSPPAVAVLSEGDRWRGWSAPETLMLVSALSPGALWSRPQLAHWHTEALLRLGVEPGQGEALARAAAGCVATGWEPPVPALVSLATLLFESLTDGQLLEVYDPPDSGARALLALVCPIYEPKSPTALARWARLCSSACPEKVSPRAGHLLQQGIHDLGTGGSAAAACDTGKLLEALQLLRDLALRDDRQAEEAHRRWLRLCERERREAPGYLLALLQSGARPAWSEEAMTIALDAPVEELLVLADRFAAVLRSAKPPESVRCVLTLVCLLKQVEDRSTIAQDPDIERNHLRIIRDTFRPAMSVTNADMTAELLDVLRQHVPKSWLTPLAAQVEALVEAGRHEEARQLPGLTQTGATLAVRGIPAEDFIRRSRRANRTRPAEADDYRKVIQSVVSRWACNRKSRAGAWRH
jgi:superfamily II DNA helicase RecQ